MLLFAIYVLCFGILIGCDTSRSNTGSEDGNSGNPATGTPKFTASNVTVSCSYFADDDRDYARTVVKGNLQHDGKTSVGAKVMLELKTAAGVVLDTGTFAVPYSADSGNYIASGQTVAMPDPIMFFKDYSLKCASIPKYVLTVTSIYSSDHPAGKAIDNQQVYP